MIAPSHAPSEREPPNTASGFYFDNSIFKIIATGLGCWSIWGRYPNGARKTSVRTSHCSSGDVQTSSLADEGTQQAFAFSERHARYGQGNRKSRECEQDLG